MQTYNLFQSTSKLFQRTFLLSFTTHRLILKADAKIKSISFTIQVKIQKFSENLFASKAYYIRAQLLLYLSCHSLKAGANIQPIFTSASSQQKLIKFFFDIFQTPPDKALKMTFLRGVKNSTLSGFGTLKGFSRCNQLCQSLKLWQSYRCSLR